MVHHSSHLPHTNPTQHLLRLLWHDRGLLLRLQFFSFDYNLCRNQSIQAVNQTAVIKSNEGMKE